MTETLRAREDIQAAVAGRTTCDLLRDNAREFGARPALSWRATDGRTETLTWAEYRSEVAAATLGLTDLGVSGEVVALMGTTRPEHHLADQAVVHAGATPATLYRTLAPEQIAHTAGNAAARVAVLENDDYLQRWLEVEDELEDLETIVLVEGAEQHGDRDDVMSWEQLLARGRERAATEPDRFEELADAVQPDDLCVLLYTSGTTGRPKGVGLTHANVLFETESLERLIDLSGHPGFISYLPLAHIAERLASLYLPLKVAGHTFCCPDPGEVRDYLLEARPALFFGVPRVWEKFRAGIETELAAEQSAARRRLAEHAIKVGRAVCRLQQAGERPSLVLQAEYKALDALVLSKIREAIGLDECAYAVSAAAPLPDDVAEFFAAIGLPLLEVYGLTETTGVATANVPEKTVIGTVGAPIPGVEARRAEDGELLLRGPITTEGYRDLPEETEQLLDGRGWLHTGDLCEIREDGYVTIVDRKKELIITSGGENIAPSAVEAHLKEHPLVGHAVAYGDGRSYLVALIVLDEDRAPQWAAEHGIEQSDVAELASHPEVRAEINQAVEAANSKLARPQQVKHHTVLPVTWGPGSEELTPTLKLKRRVIHERYAEEIEALYA